MPQLHQALAVIAAFYMACTLLRLARFNIETAVEPGANKRFRGLPSPGAAGCIATLGILRDELPKRWPTAFDPESVRLLIQVWAPLGALALALLMVSRVPFPHLTKQILGGRRRKVAEPGAYDRAADVLPRAGAGALVRVSSQGQGQARAAGGVPLPDRHSFSHLVQIILAGFLILLVWDLALAFLFWLYALGVPLRYVIMRSLRRGQARTLDQNPEEPLRH
jgi:hypothetical protein